MSADICLFQCSQEVPLHVAVDTCQSQRAFDSKSMFASLRTVAGWIQ